jgi:hypothetical protein
MNFSARSVNSISYSLSESASIDSDVAVDRDRDHAQQLVRGAIDRAVAFLFVRSSLKSALLSTQ